MLRNLCVILLWACIGFRASAAIAVAKNYPDTLLKIKDPLEKEKKLISYIRNSIQNSGTDSVSAVKTRLITFLKQHHIENAAAITCFAESLYQRRLTHMEDAEAAMIKAIGFARENQDSFLLYNFYSHLAFIQTDEGNAIEAVTNYGLAKKEAIKLEDPKLQQMIDVNISDVYYKNNLYNQSLSYLSQAEVLGKRYNLDNVHIDKVIYYNKAENFFRMNKPDSLKKYNEKLKAIK